MKTLLTLTLLVILCYGCNMGPKEINYGEDHCHYCSMTIVDRQFGAQLVTKKGRSYKYDAAECMIQSLSEMETETISHFLVTDYMNPENLIDAQSAVFIVSPNIPSPMRANLSALSSKESAVTLKDDKDGDLFSWEEIQKYIKENIHVTKW